METRTVFSRSGIVFTTLRGAMTIALPGDRIFRLEQSREGREWFTDDQIIECDVTIRDLMPHLSAEERAVITAIQTFPRNHAGCIREIGAYCANPSALRGIGQNTDEAQLVDAVRRSLRAAGRLSEQKR